MTRLGRTASAFWLALALLVGQQAAALHCLKHATEQLSQKKDSRHLPSTCDKCFACAELSGAAAATMPVVPLVAAASPPSPATVDACAASAAGLAYRSQAPPAIL